MVSGLWVLGTVQKARDCPRLLGQSRSSGILGLCQSSRFLQDSPGFYVSEIEKKTLGVGTLSFWDRVKVPGLSWAFGALAKTQHVPGLSRI